MVQLRQIHSANDNAPLKTSFYGKLKSRPSPVIAQTSNSEVTKPQKTTSSATYSNNAGAVIAWVTPIFAAIFGIYAIWKQMPLGELIWPSLILGTLLFFTAAIAERHSRLRNFSGLFMVGAFTTVLAAFLSQNDFTLIGMELTLLIASIALFVGWLFKSKPAVLLSSFMSCLLYTSPSPRD